LHMVTQAFNGKLMKNWWIVSIFWLILYCISHSTYW